MKAKIPWVTMPIFQNASRRPSFILITFSAVSTVNSHPKYAFHTLGKVVVLSTDLTAHQNGSLLRRLTT